MTQDKVKEKVMEKEKILEKEMVTLFGILPMDDFARVMEKGRSTVYDWKDKKGLPANCYVQIAGNWYVVIEEVQKYIALKVELAIMDEQGIRKDKQGGYSYKFTICGKQYQGSCVDCTTKEQALEFVTQRKAEVQKFMAA